MKIVIFIVGVSLGMLTHHVLCYMGLLEKYKMLCPYKKNKK